jgi:hypothetical protein
MLITHKDTATIGDFANTWPYLSEIAKRYGPVDISLPGIYQKFLGLKEFLEYQDFVNTVDFEDSEGDLDVQAHANESLPIPKRSYYTAVQHQWPIDRNLILKVPDISIPEKLLQKPIVIDRTFNNTIKTHGMFLSDEYQWLDYTMPISYNINICLKTKQPIYATFTGLPIILDLFNVEQTLIWFDDVPGQQAFEWHYFPERKTKLIYYKDFKI